MRCFALVAASTALSVSSTDSICNAKLTKLLECSRRKYNGTSAVGYVADSSRILAAASVGAAQRYGESPDLDLYGRMHMGSNTKSLTVTLLAILLENGLIEGARDGWNSQLKELLSEVVTGTFHAAVSLADVASFFSGLHTNVDNYWTFFYTKDGDTVPIVEQSGNNVKNPVRTKTYL